MEANETKTGLRSRQMDWAISIDLTAAHNSFLIICKPTNGSETEINNIH